MNITIENKAGFSLIEMIVVIVVLGIVAAVAMQSMTASVEDIRRTDTEREMEMLAEAIVGNPNLGMSGSRADFGYVGDVGAFPPDLQALYHNPGGFATWDGPYLPPGFVQDSAGYAIDAWGKFYSYNGGIVIASTGSGVTITKKIAASDADYLFNHLHGTVRDADDSVPGRTYMDSIEVEITIPDGGGGLVTKAYAPDSAGAFTLDSLPVGTHPLRCIFSPLPDTIVRYVTILPRHKSAPAAHYRFASAHFSSGGGCGMGSVVLRPIAQGTLTELIANGCGSNWQCVSEITADDDDSYVTSLGTAYATDLYDAGDPADTTCTIVSVTVYVRARQFIKTAYGKVVMRTNSADFEGPEETLTDGYVDYNRIWTSNPATGMAWTWADIAGMEIGVALRGTKSTHPARCTQVWLVVDYTE